ncbi:MAG: VCBS repeat-containing protein [Cyclobacteriaceae bacterium]
MKNLHPITSFLVVALALTFLSSCENQKRNSRQLAKRHCSSCHLFPDPSLLDKKTWKYGVLPEMAFRMGLDISKLPGTNAQELNEILKVIPSEPLLSEEDWKSIKEYYINTAPDIVYFSRENKSLPLHQFTASPITLPINGKNMLTMIRADHANNKIFIGTHQRKLFQLTNTLTLEDSFQLISPPSDILFSMTENPIFSCMGIMDPNDQRAGSVRQLSTLKSSSQLLIDSIKRPVNIQQADMNNDDQQDLIVSAFGNFTGALYAYEKSGDEYRQHIIHNFPGTRQTIIRDFNEDALPDILALITQGDEQIALFTNRGNFRFSYQVLLKFPPVYGSSYFELCDFNRDGHPDILYTNGDNADYSVILKPYHGVRIFLNDGKNHFAQSWFFPMHGASMARAADFDEDGDMDIAAISFFPDFNKHPEHSFIYFENDQRNFTPHITALAASSRWITMELADIDDDRDLDLILGSLTFPNGVPDSLFQVWKKREASLLILKNNLR